MSTERNPEVWSACEEGNGVSDDYLCLEVVVNERRLEDVLVLAGDGEEHNCLLWNLRSDLFLLCGNTVVENRPWLLLRDLSCLLSGWE